MEDELKKLRSRIDAADDGILKLLARRARLVEQVGRLKGKGGTVYRPEREAQVLRRAAAGNTGPLPAAAITSVFTEIMSACRALEAPTRVAFLGPRGTYSEEASVRHFGSAIERVACASIDEVFRAVESGAAGYGVVPVENSTEGAIGRTLDLLLATPLSICGEVALPIHQCLMSKSGDRGRIRKIFSHTQSLAQTHEWLNANCPGVERVAVVSNAEAARMAAADRLTGAVAGRTAAEIYGLRIIAASIEDEPNNTTRFLVIGGPACAPSGQDRTSMVLSTRNVPGAIHELLTPLARNGVSMSKLESRPARAGLWEYVFFVDVEGHQADANVAAALAQVRTRAAFLKILGSYPVARG